MPRDAPNFPLEIVVKRGRYLVLTIAVCSEFHFDLILEVWTLDNDCSLKVVTFRQQLGGRSCGGKKVVYLQYLLLGETMTTYRLLPQAP